MNVHMTIGCFLVLKIIPLQCFSLPIPVLISVSGFYGWFNYQFQLQFSILNFDSQIRITVLQFYSLLFSSNFINCFCTALLFNFYFTIQLMHSISFNLNSAFSIPVHVYNFCFFFYSVFVVMFPVMGLCTVSSSWF